MMYDEFTKAPSQDELIVEFASLFMSNKPTDERVEEAKKRYRITRVK